MAPVVISLIVFLAVFGGSVLGITYRSLLTEHHLSSESREFVLTIGLELAGVIAAFVLALAVTAAQSTFHEQYSEMSEVSAKILLLDSVLIDYGSDAREARATLRKSLINTIDVLWPDNNMDHNTINSDLRTNKALYKNILSLKPNNEYQESLRHKALEISFDIEKTRDLLLIQQVDYIPRTFIIVLVLLTLWFVFIFFGLGIYAPVNSTVIMMLILSALSVAIAFFMIIDLNLPFQGILHMPKQPFEQMLQYLT